MAVKFAGAAYLLYIGMRALMTRSNGLPGRSRVTAATGAGRHSAQGIVTNLLNRRWHCSSLR
jgi:threonine/homoserine/homoserine lactone efflux protein